MRPICPLTYSAESCGVDRMPASRRRQIVVRLGRYAAKPRAGSCARQRTILSEPAEKRLVARRTKGQSASDIAACLTSAHRQENRLAHSSAELPHVAA